MSTGEIVGTIGDRTGGRGGGGDPEHGWNRWDREIEK